MSELEQESPMVTEGNSNIPNFDESDDVKYLGHLDQRKWDTSRQVALTTPGMAALLQEIAYQIKCRRKVGAPAPAPAAATPETKAVATSTYEVPRDKLFVALVNTLPEHTSLDVTQLLATVNDVVDAVEVAVNS